MENKFQERRKKLGISDDKTTYHVVRYIKCKYCNSTNTLHECCFTEQAAYTISSNYMYENNIWEHCANCQCLTNQEIVKINTMPFKPNQNNRRFKKPKIYNSGLLAESARPCYLCSDIDPLIDELDRLKGQKTERPHIWRLKVKNMIYSSPCYLCYDVDHLLEELNNLTK